MQKQILVSDLDPITPMYSVVDEDGWDLGEKCPAFGYLKPEYPRRGKSRSIDARRYKTAPPWFKLEVFKIDRLGGFLTFHVRKNGEPDEK